MSIQRTVWFVFVVGVVAARVGSAGSPEPAPASVLADLPFLQDTPAGRVSIDLAPEGQRAWPMRLSPESPRSLMTPSKARELGVSIRRDRSSSYRKRTRLGRDLQFGVYDVSSDTGSRMGMTVGFIGRDFLDDYVIEIDFPERRVRFIDPKTYRLPETVNAADQRLIDIERGNEIAVPIQFEGRELRALLATSTPAVLIVGKAAEKAGIDVNALQKFADTTYLSGPIATRFYESQDLRIAGFELGTTPTVIHARGLNLPANADAMVGWDALRDFVVRIDYGERRVWLKRSEQETTPTFWGVDYELSQGAGVYIGQDDPGRFQIGLVVPGTPADRIGLRVGDELKASGAGREAGDSLLRRIAAGESVTVYRGGEELQLE